MQEIKITFDEKNRLQATEYAWDKNGQKKILENIKGEEVTEFLSIIKNEQIKGTKIFKENTLIIIYEKYFIALKDYKRLHKLGVLDDYFSTISKYEKSKKESIAPVVKRENKHTGRKIVAGTLVTLMLLTSYYINHLMNLIHSEEKDLKREDVPVQEITNEQKPTESIVSPEIFDNTNQSHIVNQIKLPQVLEEDMYRPPIKENIKYEESNVETEVEEEIDETEIDESNYVVIEYRDRSHYDKAVKAKALYGDIIEKYAKMYGLDPNLVLAVATQERGTHSTVVDPGGGLGLMQLQKKIWVDYTLTAYNHETGENDKIYITLEKLQDCETNIQLGCMILQTFMKQNNYNIILGLQAYNMGTRGVGRAVKAYAEEIGQTKEEVINNPLDCGWLDYREGIAGDSLYVEHVLSYMGSDFDTYVYKKDGTKVTCNVKLHEQVLTNTK